VKCWGENWNGQVILLELFENFIMSAYGITEHELTIFVLMQCGDLTDQPAFSPVQVVSFNGGIGSIALGDV
jgi:hypothetical protein